VALVISFFPVRICCVAGHGDGAGFVATYRRSNSGVCKLEPTQCYSPLKRDKHFWGMRRNHTNFYVYVLFAVISTNLTRGRRAKADFLCERATAKK
jgi:hypothetical protein